jgi:hypothetical protein
MEDQLWKIEHGEKGREKGRPKGREREKEEMEVLKKMENI